MLEFVETNVVSAEQFTAVWNVMHPLFASTVPPPPFTVQALSIHWSPDRAESFQMRRSVWPLRLSVPLLTPLMPQR